MSTVNKTKWAIFPCELGDPDANESNWKKVETDENTHVHRLQKSLF